MKIIIDNRIKLLNPPPEVNEWLINELTFPNPKYAEAVKYGRYTGNIPEFLKLYSKTPNGLFVPRGFLQKIEKRLFGKGNDIEIIDNRVLNDPINIDSLISLRPYQEPAKYDLLENPNGMLIAPAGSGKTVLGLDVFATLRQKMLWLTHTKRLAGQVIDRILGTDEDSPLLGNITKDDIGMLGIGKWKIGEKATVGIIQTLVRRLEMLQEIGREFGLVIVDEAHHVPASTFLKVLGYFSAYYLYGLTATPYRRDKLENIMFATLGGRNAEIQRYSVKKEKGIITPKVIVREIPAIICEDNDFQYILRELLIPNEHRLLLIAIDVIKEAQAGNCCIVISLRKEYCEMLHDVIKRGWNKVGIATGDYSDKHNNSQVEKLESGEITALVTTFELLGEGFDVKKLNRGFLALPFKEKTRVEQAVGRIQRTCSGKEDAVLYDYVDSNIGILKNQFRHRIYTYQRLGMEITFGE